MRSLLGLVLLLMAGYTLYAWQTGGLGSKTEPAPQPLALQAYPGPIAAQEAPCQEWKTDFIRGESLDPVLKEMSGLAYSRIWKDVLYHITDSGNPALIYLTDNSGKLLGTLPFADKNSDAEDLAVAACPWEGSCIYVADTGDNFHLRSTRQLHIIAEDEGWVHPRRVTLELRYPDGEAFDIEALAVDPAGKFFYLFTKEKGQSQVLQGRLTSESGVQELTRVGTIQRTMVTGASFHPLRHRILLINYQGALELSDSPGLGFERRERTWFPFERRLRTPSLAQQEAITYSLDGRDWIMSSEQKVWAGHGALWGIAYGRCLPSP